MAVSPTKRGWTVAAVFALLDAALLYWHRPPAVPARDVAVWTCTLVGLVVLVTTDEYRKKKKKNKNYPVLRVPLDEFHRKGRLLEVLVGVGTIVVPWIAIIASPSPKTAYLLAPHLFVVQAHISGEGVLETLGPTKNDWYMFLYTCWACAYRVLPFTTWTRRLVAQLVQADTTADATARTANDVFMILLLAYATMVWTYWTFWYVPFVWCPLLEWEKRLATATTTTTTTTRTSSSKKE